jgi:hypothetical protein
MSISSSPFILRNIFLDAFVVQACKTPVLPFEHPALQEYFGQLFQVLSLKSPQKVLSLDALRVRMRDVVEQHAMKTVAFSSQASLRLGYFVLPSAAMPFSVDTEFQSEEMQVSYVSQYHFLKETSRACLFEAKPSENMPLGPL